MEFQRIVLVASLVAFAACAGEETPQIEKVCKEAFATTGCTTADYFSGFLGPQMDECKALYDLPDFTGWLDDMGTDFRAQVTQQQLHDKLIGRLLEFGRSDEASKHSKLRRAQADSLANGAIECPAELGELKDPNRSNFQNIGETDSNVCVDAEPLECSSTKVCGLPQAQTYCAKTCGFCGDVCADHLPTKDCQLGAGKPGTCQIQKFAEECPLSCGTCGSGIVCDLPKCPNPVGLTSTKSSDGLLNEEDCWIQADLFGQGRQWTADMRACARRAANSLKFAKAAVESNRNKKFAQRWSCQMVSLGSSLGFVCAGGSEKASIDKVICKGLHYSQTTSSCKREFTRANGEHSYQIGLIHTGTPRPRILSKQLKCTNVEGKPNGGNRRLLKESDQKSSAPELFCNVTKILGCRNAGCQKTSCTGSCEVEMMHF